MKTWTTLLAMIILMAAPAVARDIVVRSGDHNGFTRLVFYTKPNDGYDITRSDTGYVLSLTSGIDRYDLSRAFELIARTRVKTLNPLGAGQLAIVQDCDCHIKKFRLPTGELVIDVIDGPDPNAAPVAGPSPLHPSDSVNITTRRASLPLFSATADHATTVVTQGVQTEGTTQQTLQPATTPQALDKQELLAQLSQAASEGLIDANVTPPDLAAITASPEPDTPAPVSLPPSAAPQKQVRLQTAVEQARIDRQGGHLPIDTEQACLPDEQFDIASWGMYAPGSDAPIFDAANYLGEFDHPDAELLAAHIRQTIYMTFGLEAQQLIESYGTHLADRDILRMMAEVVERGEAESYQFLVPQLACNTRSAMWAALAQPSLPERINTKAILRSFSELPPHLRRHLAPILARKFLNAGRVETAIEVRNLVARTESASSGSNALLDADIVLAEGNTTAAAQILSETIQTDMSKTLPAIVTLVKGKLDHDQGISDSELSLLTTVVFEHKDGKLGPSLKGLHIRTLLHMGRFPAAFQHIDELLKSSQEPESTKLLGDAGRALLSLASDADFLTFSLARQDWSKVDPDTKLSMAKRLEGLGFLEQARRFVISGDARPDRDTREFLAQIALKQGKPKVALGYLAGLSSDMADTLRASAMEVDLTNLNGNENDGHTEPQGDLTPTIASIPEHILATLDQSKAQSATNSETDLQTYQSILDSSGATRATLAELLSLFPTAKSNK